MTRLLTILLLLSIVFSAEAQKKNKKSKNAAPVEKKEEKPKDKNGIKPYSKVITKDAKSDQGLFAVHKIDTKYFYEIPDSLLDREMLMVTRIAKTATGIGFGGGKANEQVLRWQRQENQILLRVVSYNIVAADSLPIHEAVVNSNFEPVLFAFPIKALAKDSAGVVIDV